MLHSRAFVIRPGAIQPTVARRADGTVVASVIVYVIYGQFADSAVGRGLALWHKCAIFGPGPPVGFLGHGARVEGRSIPALES